MSRAGSFRGAARRSTLPGACHLLGVITRARFVGAYHKRGQLGDLVSSESIDVAEGIGDRWAGFNVGGGIEYFTGRTVSLKGEARYHVIGKTRTGQDPSGLVFTGGLKKYW